MDEKQVRKIAQEVYNQNHSGNEFTVSSIPFHTHNGTDSQRVKQNDIINGVTSLLGLNIFATETDTINTIQNITQIF